MGSYQFDLGFLSDRGRGRRGSRQRGGFGADYWDIPINTKNLAYLFSHFSHDMLFSHCKTKLCVQLYNYLYNCVFQNTLKCGYIGPHGCGFQYLGFSIQVTSKPGPMNSYAGPKMSLPIQLLTFVLLAIPSKPKLGMYVV